jgi:hypothetical protein
VTEVAMAATPGLFSLAGARLAAMPVAAFAFVRRWII